MVRNASLENIGWIKAMLGRIHLGLVWQVSRKRKKVRLIRFYKGKAGLHDALS